MASAAVASRAISGAACSSSSRSMNVSSTSNRGSSSPPLVDRRRRPCSSSRASSVLGRLAPANPQINALGSVPMFAMLEHKKQSKQSPRTGRIAVRSVQGDDDGTAAATTTTSTSSASISEKLLALLAAAPDRGVYGLPSEQKEAILSAIAELEKLEEEEEEEEDGSAAGSLSVSDRLPSLAGRWRVLFSTVTITGSKRVKLGLKSAVTLGDLIQTIDPETSTATNEVGFELRFLGGGGRGALRLDAGFRVSGREHPRRVEISLASAALTPPALDKLLGQHMALLLSIFNPEGWLETTFADERLRVGRDDKGRVFVLERVE